MLLKVPEIPGNIKDSGIWFRRFQGILLKIPGNAPEDFGESRFPVIL